VLVAHELADAQAFADRLAVLDRGCLLQVGAPDEVVLRPASRRVAELVGYLGFVPASGADSGATSGTEAGQTVAGIHPDRVAAGALPDRGLVLTGTVTGFRPAGAGWEADLLVGDAMITCRLPDKPAPADGEVVVTALDPPYFGTDGVALPAAPAAPADDGLSRPQVHG
jgi:ABC-type sugar transport system ATPase subunit